MLFNAVAVAGDIDNIFEMREGNQGERKRRLHKVPEQELRPQNICVENMSQVARSTSLFAFRTEN